MQNFIPRPSRNLKPEGYHSVTTGLRGAGCTINNYDVSHFQGTVQLVVHPHSRHHHTPRHPPHVPLKQRQDLDVDVGEFVIFTSPRKTRAVGSRKPYAVILHVMPDTGPPTMRGTIGIPHGVFKAMPDMLAVQAFASKLKYKLPDGSTEWLLHGAPASE